MGEVREVRTAVEAGRIAGVVPATVRGWVRTGWLPAPPWSRAQILAARQLAPSSRIRGTSAAHGTTSRWSAGCRCTDCRSAHSAETTAARNAAMQAEWDTKADALLAAFARGGNYADVLRAAGVTTQALHAHRRRDPDFAARLDDALVAGRDPDLPHATGRAWTAGCRCPDCREYHNATR